MTPEERYATEPYYHSLVTTFWGFIRSGQYTMEDIQDMARLANERMSDSLCRPIEDGSDQPREGEL